MRAGALGGLVALIVAGCSTPETFDSFDTCTPGEPPDEACYVARRDPSSPEIALALSLARRYAAVHPATQLRWDWTDGVLVYAITELARVTGDAELRAYYRDYIEHHLAGGYDFVWSDSCPPVLAAIALHVETGDPRYTAVVDDALHYLRDLALRTEEGGISHLGILDVRTLWLDSLFMFGMVLDRWAEVAGDRAALDEMGEQLAIFTDRLQDPGGLFVHADGWPLPQDPDVYWARGNAWVTVAAADYLRVRARRRERDHEVSATLRAQVAAIIAAQDPATGAWHTVVNRPASYLETSATALFAYGMARGYRYGVVDDDVLPSVARAMTAVRATIHPDDAGAPVVTGISGPTLVGTYDDYAAVPLVDDAPYGVGAVILALIETSGLPR